MVAIELAYINTKHPDFHREASLVSTLMHAHIEDSNTHKVQTKQLSKKQAISYSSLPSVTNGESPTKEVSYCLAKVYQVFKTLIFHIEIDPRTKSRVHY